MSATFEVAETLIQLFRQICSRIELKVQRNYEYSSLHLARSNKDLRHSISINIESESALQVALLITDWHNDRKGQNVFYDRIELGSLGVLRIGLRVFGDDLHIQYIVTDVSGSMVTVDILASSRPDGQHQKIATVHVDQHKDQITNIELAPLD